MTTPTREQVVQLIAEIESGSNWLSGKHNVYSYKRQPKIAAMFLKSFVEQGLPELIAELRKPEDWKLEGFGHFKDVTMSKSDAPFRAADMLHTLARADLSARIESLEAENARISRSYTEELDKVSNRNYEFRQQLAESQAREQGLREAIAILRCKTDPKYGVPIADKALSQSTDSTALREWGAELIPPEKLLDPIYTDEGREQQFGQMMYASGWNDCRNTIADKIRKGEF